MTAPLSAEALAEWRERIGERLMLAMKCTHDGDEFGLGAVCVTCFANVQAIGAVVGAEVDRLLAAHPAPPATVVEEPDYAEATRYDRAEVEATPPEPQSAPEDVRLTEEERDQILDAILDDRSRAEGYSVLGPGGTDGQTPTVYEAVGRILAARLATAEQKWREAGARDALAEVERRIAASGCDCTELCSMGPTCPGGMLAGLPGSGCWRADAPIHDGNHAPLPEGVWLDPGYCEHCDRKRANYRSERGL